MRLMALLRELVRDHGRKKAATILGVDRRTLDGGMDAGVLSRRMRRALDRALQTGVGSAAAEQRDRNDKLEERLTELQAGHETLAREIRRRMASIERGMEELKRDDTRKAEELRGIADPSASGQGDEPHARFRKRRDYPTLVTLEPAEDDAEVFGDAWPLIIKWRKLKGTHPNQGKGLAWLVEHQRLLEVELALLEEHGMTLPPEKQPLHGLDRSGQTSWRHTALFDTRRAITKRELVRKVLTLGLWKKQPDRK